jgi:hypothetical protein
MKTWSLIALESLEISEENEKVVGDQGSVCVCGSGGTGASQNEEVIDDSGGKFMFPFAK